jgi:hypothetical protein
MRLSSKKVLTLKQEDTPTSSPPPSNKVKITKCMSIESDSPYVYSGTLKIAGGISRG